MDTENVLAKRQGETELQYHRRLLEGKLIDRTIDLDYSTLSPYLYGKSYAPDVARRMAYGSMKTLELLNQEKINTSKDEDDGLMDELEEKIIELQKERQKFYDQRRAYNAAIRKRAREEELNEIISDAINNSQLPELKYVPSDIESTDRTMLISLNDIHYGATYDNYWGKYDSHCAWRMIDEYILQIRQIANRHECSDCVVWSNGDAISGLIHLTLQITNRENVIEQVMGVSELISYFLHKLSMFFNKVKFVSVAGNHSRLTGNKDKDNPDERLDDLITWYLEARLKEIENVEFYDSFSQDYKQIDETMYVVNIHGKNYLGVHGDYDLTPAKIQSLQTMAGMPIYAVLMGHLHHNKVDVVQGIRVVMAGSFLGTDDYCARQRIYGEPEQMVCICDESGIQCYYNITFNSNKRS